MNIICKWSGYYLWGIGNMNGLGIDSQGEYYVISFETLKITGPFSKRALIDCDLKWLTSISKIESGFPPDWRECSCGASAVMGKDWTGHTALCDALTLKSPFEPKNNDGRKYCYKCGIYTKSAGGGQYLICVNKACSWYEK